MDASIAETQIPSAARMCLRTAPHSATGWRQSATPEANGPSSAGDVRHRLQHRPFRGCRIFDIRDLSNPKQVSPRAEFGPRLSSHRA